MSFDVPGSDLPRYGASPVEAVRRFWTRYAVFTGRASRSEYWWAALANAVVGIVLGTGVVVLVVLGAVARQSSDAGGAVLSALGAVLGVVLLLYVLATIVPSYAVAVRRLHDADLSGWFVLVGLIPSVGGLILLVLHVLPSTPAGRRFDRVPERWAPAQPVRAIGAPVAATATSGFPTWPSTLEPAPATSPVPSTGEGAVAAPMLTASVWTEVAAGRAVEPPFTAPAAWRRTPYLLVERPVPLLATDGLSRGEGVAALGPGAEVYLPGDAGTPEEAAAGWRLRVVASVARRVAASGMHLPAELEQYGTLSMTVPSIDAPDGWCREDGALGVLIGLPVPGVPDAVGTPGGEVRLVSVLPLRPVELQRILDGGTAARAALAADLGALPVSELLSADREAVAISGSGGPAA